jgi:hypothetical protein
MPFDTKPPDTTRFRGSILYFILARWRLFIVLILLQNLGVFHETTRNLKVNMRLIQLQVLTAALHNLKVLPTTWFYEYTINFGKLIIITASISVSF